MLGAQTEFQPSFVQLSDFMITIFCHSCEDFNRTSPCERLAYFKHKLLFFNKKDLQKSCKESTKSSVLYAHQLNFPRRTSYITIVYLSKERD
jgi:hypothetical protein